MFRLTETEYKGLILQNATSKKGRGGRRTIPYAFTEHGAIMAANILNSNRAIKASVQVVRAFIQLRQMLSSNAELTRKLDDLEKNYDRKFKIVFDTLRQLMTPIPSRSKPIGFRATTPRNRSVNWFATIMKSKSTMRIGCLSNPQKARE